MLNWKPWILQFQRDGLPTSSFFLWKQIQLTLISIIFSFLSMQWDEISNSVWCCPVKVKAAVKDSSSRTGLALALFGLFYPKEELGGRRLHQLDQDIIEAITGISTKVLWNEIWLHLFLIVSLALPREILRGEKLRE